MAVQTNLLIRLYDIEAVKFGNFTLKSGIQSPIYFDLRVIISHPDVMKQVSELLWIASKNCSIPYASICGVPYTALPLATCISAYHDIPMLIRRKEAKSYGTKKLVEGQFCTGDVCLVIEDVVTTGSSVRETVEALTSEGLKVHDAVVLLDREQGGKENLAATGVQLHSVISISQLLDCLLKVDKIDQAMVDSVKRFLAENHCLPFLLEPSKDSNLMKVVSHQDRAQMCTHPVGRRLFEIMNLKRTNLALSADVDSSHRLLQLADDVGPYICVLKTHVDILKDFTLATMKVIMAMYGFLLLKI